MVPRSANKQVLGFIAVSAVLASLFFVGERDWPAEQAAVPIASSQPMPSSVVPSTPIAQAAGRSQDVAARDNRVVVRMPALRRDFETDHDLYAYVQRLDAAVRAADPDATWMVSRVYDYCAGYAMAPVNYIRDTEAIAAMGLHSSKAMVAARERVSQRCARFEPQDRLFSALQLRRTDAAKAGSLAAEAALAASGRPLSDDDDYMSDLVSRVRQSGDPEAYLALSPAMGIAASGKPELANEVAGTQFTELAWQLAACERGMDCGPDSALMTAYCANGGICSRESGQDFKRFVYDAAVPRQGAELVKEMVASLLGDGRGWR
jgi:hypothetical protein